MPYKKVKTHYRKNYKTNHPAYIFAYIPKTKEYKYIGITHSPVTDGIKNIKMADNPNPKDKSQSYFRPFASKGNEKIFSRYKYPWNTSKANGQIARKIKYKNKQ